MTHRLGLGVCAGAFAIGLALTGPGCSSGEVPKIGVCPPGQTCQTRLTILHTSDIHSRLLPYDLLITQVDGNLGLGATEATSSVGGVARMAYLLGRERARADRVIHLDSGDCFQGAPIFNFFSGEPEVRSLSLLGVDAAVIGNHEFDRGTVNVAMQMQRWASFALLGANYKFGTPDKLDNTGLGNVVKPFSVFNRDGLKIAVIGMGNLSSLTSVFDQPNRQGIQPLNTADTAQFYVDLLRPHVDVIAFTTHLGLEVDQRMIRNTTGIDVVMGGHNHVVISPPQVVQDCSADLQNPGYIWVADPELDFDPQNPPNDALHPDPVNHPGMVKRACKPRNVVLAHSGAFAKFVGRLDLVLSNDPAEVSPTGNPADYEPVNRFEVLSNKYVAIPVNDQVPEDPVVSEMLLPYRRTLDRVADLDLLVGYSPLGARRFGTQGGDSPLGNLVATAMWLRLGIQTDFSLTNSAGIRQDLLPGPITFEQMYNIFPFDNSITKMQLSGVEVQEMMDFVARRSAGRGCAAQAQIAGARVRINCAGCTRPDAKQACATDNDCIGGTKGSCQNNVCAVTACAEQVYIGHTDKRCATDADCPGAQPGQCDRPQGAADGLCQTAISTTNLYELATSNYLASGGSGFRVLQRNTTQFDTKIQQRDALIDYIRQGRPCGYDPNAGTQEGLPACASDADCGQEFVCACPGHAVEDRVGTSSSCRTEGSCDPSVGRCVRRDCRDQVAAFHNRLCTASPYADACRVNLNACVIAGEECKILACVDDKLGAITDNRIEVLGR